MGGEQHLVIVSGLSGAGMSTTLNALEDMGYHCIDNLPAKLLQEFGPHMQAEPGLYDKVALGIDARAPGLRLEELPPWLQSLRDNGLNAQLLFLTASDETLVTRFSKTRRKHPLAQDGGGLTASIARERALLEPVRAAADWEIDTSDTNIHQLRHQTWKCIGPDSAGTTVVIQSFAFSKGVPSDADFLFDTRNLPNPYWNAELRKLTGRDGAVAEWLQQDAKVTAMADDITAFLRRWLPELEASHRSFVTVAVGCTGGQHRSVYLAERLATDLRQQFPEIMTHHRDLDA